MSVHAHTNEIRCQESHVKQLTHDPLVHLTLQKYTKSKSISMALFFVTDYNLLNQLTNSLFEIEIEFS